MSYRKSEEKRSTGIPLRDISHRQSVGSVKGEGLCSGSKVQHGSYIEENHQLRIKCAKIDQIEKYTNILMENMEKYKKWNEELEIRVAELVRDNEKLRIQLSAGTNIRILKDQNTKKQGQLHNMRRKIVQTDNFHLIKLQQELTNERQMRQKVIINLENKHKAEISRIQHQFKANINQLQHENQMIKSQTDNFVKQNSYLKAALSQLQQEYSHLSNLNSNLNLEINSLKQAVLKTQQELGILNHGYTSLEDESHSKVSNLMMQLEGYKGELEKAIIAKQRLQKMNQHLKSQGGTLILEAQQAKIRNLQLQDLHRINSVNIKNLQQQLSAYSQSSKYLQSRMMDCNNSNKQIIDNLERQIMLSKKDSQNLSIEVSTKQKQIEDLIMIVSKLQTDVKITSSTAMILQKSNNSLLEQLKEKQSIISETMQELQKSKRRINDLEMYVSQVQSLKISVSSMNSSNKEVNQLLLQQQLRVKEFQSIIETDKRKLLELEYLNGQLSLQLQEQQRLNESWKDGKEYYEKMFNQEKSQSALYKNRILQLESLASQLQNLLREVESEKNKQKHQHQQLNSKTIKEGMQQVQKLISLKYNEMIKEYQKHYDNKIKSLQQQILALKSDLHLQQSEAS